MCLCSEDDVSGSMPGFIWTGLRRVCGIHTLHLHAFNATTNTEETHIETQKPSAVQMG